MIFASILLTVLSTYFLASVFGSFAYIFPIMLGLIILNIEILSLFRAIDFPWILLLNVLTLVLISIVWVKKGRPVLRPDMGSLKAEFKRILNCFKLDKSFIILGAGLVFLMATGFILAAFLPVNEPDALTYHTYRALIWAQKGFIHHFDTIDSRNLVMPINSEIIYTWIFSLTGKDFGFGLVQYITSFFTISGLWMILSRLKISYRKRLWTIFIFFSFASIISQISSTQTDLLVGTLLLYSMIFFYDYTNSDDFIKGFFSSLCFGIALGVKSTGFIAGLPLLILFFIYAYRKKVLKRFLWFFIALGINFIVFSSYNYILNFIDYKNPLSSIISYNAHGFFGGIKGFFSNFVNYNIQLLDTSGFNWGIFISEFIFKIRDAFFATIGIPKDFGVLMEMESINSFLNEQTIGYGVIGLLTFLPCVIVSIFLLSKSIVKGNVKEKRIILYTLGALFYINLIVLSFSIGFMVYSIRFFCTFIILSAPCLALLYPKKNNFYKTLIILFSIFYFFFVSVYLSFRPLKNLIISSKTEPSKESFIQNIRCMKYDYFKRERRSCEIDENILEHIEEYKTVGFFPDKNVMMQLTVLNAAKKHIRVEQMILTRLEKYALEKYDYIVTPYPFQILTDFNNKDIEKLEEIAPKKQTCFYLKNEGGKKIVIENKNELKKLVEIRCLAPNDYFIKKGFAPTHKIKTHWMSIAEEDKEIVSTYILWKNMK